MHWHSVPEFSNQSSAIYQWFIKSQLSLIICYCYLNNSPPQCTVNMTPVFSYLRENLFSLQNCLPVDDYSQYCIIEYNWYFIFMFITNATYHNATLYNCQLTWCEATWIFYSNYYASFVCLVGVIGRSRYWRYLFSSLNPLQTSYANVNRCIFLLSVFVWMTDYTAHLCYLIGRMENWNAFPDVLCKRRPT